MKDGGGGSSNSCKDPGSNGHGKSFTSLGSSKDSKSSSYSFITRIMIFFLLCLLLFYLICPIYILFYHPSCPTSNDVADTADSFTDSVVHLSSDSSPNVTTTSDDRTVIADSPPPHPRKTGRAAPASTEAATGLQHIVFGIAASSKLWEQRKEYIKLWWRPRQMRGIVWLDKRVKEFNSPAAALGLPTLRISGDTSRFPYTHRRGDRSAIRISRIVSETYRLRLPGVRWFVMGDDDTVFFADNLARVLSRFDHRQPYYIGSPSESHIQNILFSYSMAYGGGGFAISAPLAAALSRTQDRCLRRYPALYGSDDRIQACMAELGVPLTRHPGFHQYDVYGDLLGLLASHPVAPLISLHHLDVVQPIFPRAPSRAGAIRRLFDGPVQLDPAGMMQQSICYDAKGPWTVSVAWGFAVQVRRGVTSPREMEIPARTFLNWYRRADYTAYAFNTRPVARHPCQRPYVYYLSSARYDKARRTTVTMYERHRDNRPTCRWRMPDPSALVDRVIVLKKPDPGLWDRSPRRNCCRVKESASGKRGDRTMQIEVGICREGEVTGI